MCKELYIAAHEELIEERMSAWCDAHPDATDAEYRAAEALAYDQCADDADGRYRDKLADMVDAARDRAKYAGA